MWHMPVALGSNPRDRKQVTKLAPRCLLPRQSRPSSSGICTRTSTAFLLLGPALSVDGASVGPAASSSPTLPTVSFSFTTVVSTGVVDSAGQFSSQSFIFSTKMSPVQMTSGGPSSLVARADSAGCGVRVSSKIGAVVAAGGAILRGQRHLALRGGGYVEIEP